MNTTINTKRHFITITGRIGSGKSSTGKALAESLGYNYLSMGQMMRDYAQELGMDFNDFNERMKEDRSYDDAVDLFQQEQIPSLENTVLDSRLGWYFSPDSFKVFLDLPLPLAATRIMNDARGNHSRSVENTTSVEQIIENIKKRGEAEKERYRTLYGIENHLDYKNFDLVISTQIHPLNEIVDTIKNAYEDWLKQ